MNLLETYLIQIFIMMFRNMINVKPNKINYVK